MPAPKHNANTESFSVSNTLTASFARALNALGPFEPHPHIAVAFSGGVDSTALLLLARAWATAHGGKVSALIVDHRLRPESTQEAQDVAARYDAIILIPSHEEVSNNLPEKARDWRYGALTAWCREHDVLHLLVAHHADDQAETVSLHTARGETEDGASGMAAVSIRDGVRILRPLLGVDKVTLKDYAQSQQASWVEDPTNANLNFTRNAIRHAMTPAESVRLASIAAREGQARAERDVTFAKIAADVAEVGTDAITLDRTKFLTLRHSIATRLLADSLCVVSGQHTRPRKHESEQLYERLQREDFTRGTLKHCLIEKRGAALHISVEPRKTKASGHPKVLAASPFWWFNPRHS